MYVCGASRPSKRKCSRRVQRHNPFEPGHGSRQHIQRLTRCTGPWTGSASGARKSLDHVKRLPSALIEHDTSLASRPVRIKEQQDQICTFRLRQCSILDAELFGDRDDKTRAQVEAELPAFRKPAHDFQEVVACPLARAKELRQGSRAAHLLKHAQPAIRRQGIEAKKSVFLECASPTSQLTPRKSQTGAGGTTLNQEAATRCSSSPRPPAMLSDFTGMSILGGSQGHLPLQSLELEAFREYPRSAAHTA